MTKSLHHLRHFRAFLHTSGAIGYTAGTQAGEACEESGPNWKDRHQVANLTFFDGFQVSQGYANS